jgi:hypothetical protein
MKIIPRSTVKEVYASIEADLIYASENLAAFVLTKGRATKGALALLGRRIYIKTTSKAATTLESVITAGNYSLVADYNRF